MTSPLSVGWHLTDSDGLGRHLLSRTEVIKKGLAIADQWSGPVQVFAWESRYALLDSKTVTHLCQSALRPCLGMDMGWGTQRWPQARHFNSSRIYELAPSHREHLTKSCPI